MPLKITLKPHEKMLIGGAVITNSNSTSNLVIENKVPILREKDILIEECANSPAKRIYYVIQLMYLDPENTSNHHASYWNFTRDFINAAPSAFDQIIKISEQILIENYYCALKLARKLIGYEESVILSSNLTKTYEVHRAL